MGGQALPPWAVQSKQCCTSRCGWPNHVELATPSGGRAEYATTTPPVDALTCRPPGQSRRTWMMSKRDIDTDRRHRGAVLIAILILILICQVEASTSKIETEYLGRELT